jgi:Tol biopolymer transport system component
MLACRDRVEPYQPVDRPQNPASPVRLTYSPGDDRMPAWSLNGDTVYYSAESESEQVFPAWTPREWILMKQRRTGSSAETVLPNIQSSDSRTEYWLTSPVPDPERSRLAFIEISELWAPHTCPLRFGPPRCSPSLSEEQSRQPPVRQVRVIVRRLEATHSLDEDESLAVLVAGKEGIQTAVIHYHPFQRLFADEGAVVFRASWAPDGERLVFSDGLNLYLWRVGDETAVPVPNTEDGAWPAWGPDGEWIAFTRIEREGSTGAFCRYIDNVGAVICTQQRTDYLVGPSVLSLVRPDGSDLRELGEGSEPAWSPDGASLVFRRGNTIWSIGADGTNAEAIPGTEGGREPAVSPDGSYLALAILSDDGDYDIWTIALVP